MKSMVADGSIQVRWGGWRGGGWGYRGFGGGFGYRRGWGWGAGAVAGAVIGGAIASSAYGYYGGPAYGYGGPPYGGYYPYGYYPAYVGYSRITITVLGKQSRNPGPLASTDLTDAAGDLGAIGKRSADPAEGRRRAAAAVQTKRKRAPLAAPRSSA
jgi:hypothetical protein